MTSEETLDLILRVLRVFDGFGGPSTDDLFWRTGGEYAPVKLFAQCNDVFWWGTSDLEPITAENVGELEKARDDMKAIDGRWYHDAHLLFCARVRKMRPQGAYYAHIESKFHHLFDACGPAREVDFGNPKAQADMVEKRKDMEAAK